MINNNKTSEICIKCQKCCQRIGVLSAYPYNDYIKKFYEARGAIVSCRTLNKIDYTFIDFPFQCPNLDPEKGCLIYDNRPEACKEYPIKEDNNPILEDCELYIQGLI